MGVRLHLGGGPGLSFGADVSICATISPTGVKVSLQATTFDNIYGAFAGYGSQYGAAYGDNISKGFNVSNSDSKYLGGQAAYRIGAGLSANQNDSGVSASGGGGRAPMSSTLEIIHKYHIISAKISAWEKPF